MDATKLRKALKVAYYWTVCTCLHPTGKGLNPYQETPHKYWLTRIAPKSKWAAVKLEIAGEVKGMGYESWLRRKARTERLDCYFLNKKSDKIHALIIGSPKRLEPLVKEAWKGNQKSKVSEIREEWFNKPVKAETTRQSATSAETQIPWSQATVDRYKQTLEYMEIHKKTPNEFTDTGAISNASEVHRSIENRKLPSMYMGNLNYLMLNKQTVGFQNSLTSNVTSLVRSITDHKQLTKDYLSAHNIPVPRGTVFTNYQDALAFFKTNDFPVVVKPIEGSYGNGITVDVRTEETLQIAWNYAKQFHEHVILEELVEGIDMRILVAGGKAVAALLRVPANITGDGIHNVEELIKIKNDQRLKNPRLKKALMVTDGYTLAFLKRQGHSFTSIPAKNETVFLHLKANIQAGADSLGVMEYMHPDLLKLAEEAVEVIGVKDYWGVDMMVERLDVPRDQQHCCIIEVNSRANIYNVQFPIHGIPRDAAQAVVDYFDRTPENNNPYLQKISLQITGMLKTPFLLKASKLAREHDLKGRIYNKKNITKNMVAEAILSGNKNNILAFMDELLIYRDTKGALVDDITLIPSNALNQLETHALKETLPPETPVIPDTEKYKEHDLNTQLFLTELDKRNKNPQYLYEELIQIEEKGREAAVSMRYSSIFCDTVVERLYPLKKILRFNGIPVARGVRLKASESKKAKEYFQHLGKKCMVTCILPEKLNKSRITSATKLTNFWKKAEQKGANYILIEEDLPGKQVIVAVVNQTFAGALERTPTTIVGDGVKDIATLMDEKNDARNRNPYYRQKQITLDKIVSQRIKNEGYQATDILPKDTSLRLEHKSKYHLLGETKNITKDLHISFKQKAIEAVHAIPGLEFAFVHMIIPEPQKSAETQRWAVDWIDTNPKPAPFHYPWEGTPINLTSAVVDQLCLTQRMRWISKEVSS